MKRSSQERWVLGVSGGPDSVYLLHRVLRSGNRLVIAHMNHGARGRASDNDMEFVERMGMALGMTVRTGRPDSSSAGEASAPGFERRARDARRSFLKRVREECGASKIILAHTADDQVETILMRVFEGAGISGLKGIPRRTGEGIERPLLDTWREEIVGHLRRHRIPYRTDASNRDTRFERNWIRHVLMPLLEKRYGKAVRKRIFTLGERFREIDVLLDATARRWAKRNVKPGSDAAGPDLRLPRAPYSKLPSVVRKKIVQVLCFEAMKIAPNERLLEAMDEVILSGKPSTRLSIGKGASLSCRYGEVIFCARAAVGTKGPNTAPFEKLVVRQMEGKPPPSRLRRLATGERKAAFDAEKISGPFAVRPLRAGDRIRPFGSPEEKKVKEILIDRKVPRDERWGRPVVCDANGEIMWIPGVVRSAVAAVTRETRRTIVLGLTGPPKTGKGVRRPRVC